MVRIMLLDNTLNNKFSVILILMKRDKIDIADGKQCVFKFW